MDQWQVQLCAMVKIGGCTLETVLVSLQANTYTSIAPWLIYMWYCMSFSHFGAVSTWYLSYSQPILNGLYVPAYCTSAVTTNVGMFYTWLVYLTWWAMWTCLIIILCQCLWLHEVDVVSLTPLGGPFANSASDSDPIWWDVRCFNYPVALRQLWSTQIDCQTFFLNIKLAACLFQL